jgi:hypothetical protein
MNMANIQQMLQGAASQPQKVDINADLNQEIEDSHVDCLNASKDHTVKHLITNSKSKTVSYSTYLGLFSSTK